jgi:hypothetical protein
LALKHWIKAHRTTVVAPPFRTPAPKPLEGFKLELTDPKPYRPFRHGPNFVTMGIRKMDWNEWIELDSNYVKFHDTKVSELEKDLDGRIKYVDNEVTRLACHEMLDELVQYLPQRYPDVFQLRDGLIHNSVTNEYFPYPAPNSKEALVTASKLVQDDLVLMLENPDGQYHLDAGAVILPGFWRLTEKFRMTLDELHMEGTVPHYEAKLQKSMNRFFKGLSCEKPVIRNNVSPPIRNCISIAMINVVNKFFIQLDSGLAWSHRMSPQHSTLPASWATADSSNISIHDIHFRSERQSLRRLPKSKAIMFTVRTYFEPLTKIAEEPHVPGRLAEAIRSWDGEVGWYKGKEKWEGVVLEYLDEMAEEQRGRGVLEEKEREYPF